MVVTLTCGSRRTLLRYRSEKSLKPISKSAHIESSGDEIYTRADDVATTSFPSSVIQQRSTHTHTYTHTNTQSRSRFMHVREAYLFSRALSSERNMEQTCDSAARPRQQSKWPSLIGTVHNTHTQRHKAVCQSSSSFARECASRLVYIYMYVCVCVSGGWNMSLLRYLYAYLYGEADDTRLLE